jgi:glycosyltransferase involved in cell wall biosynthesis
LIGSSKDGEAWNLDFLQKPTVTATVSTKGRYDTTLPLTLMGIATQALLPDEVIVYDDNAQEDRVDFNKHPILSHIINLFAIKKVRFNVIYAPGQGQVPNHQHALDNCTTKYLWRIDDDNFTEGDVLAKLLKRIEQSDEIGAVGGNVFFTTRNFVAPKPDYVKANTSYHLYEGCTNMWFARTDEEEVDHLYSTFLYRVEAARKGGGYQDDLSPVGHGEETVFTARIKEAGYKLITMPNTTTWHMQEMKGGIRSYSHKFMWDHDEKRKREALDKLGWDPEPHGEKTILLEHGLGDVIAFREVLDETLAEADDDTKIIIFTGYQEVFEDYLDDPRVELLLPSQFVKTAEHGTTSVYKWMNENNFSGHITDAYRRMHK